jgi:hypothetical protein
MSTCQSAVHAVAVSTADSSTGSFFAPVPAMSPPEDVDDLVNVPNPAWSGPAQDVQPGVVALSVEIGRSESTVVLVAGARA